MGTHLYLGVLILAVFAPSVANADIDVVCGKNSVSVTWRVNAELVPYAARLFLGNCMASQWNVLPTGEGEAQFNYTFTECKFVKTIKGKRIIYRNELSYRPQAKPNPPHFVHPIECAFRRPRGWVPRFLNPGAGLSEGRSGLVFHMALLNEELSSIAKTNVITLGSPIPIWAAVEQKSHQPLLLLMEECVAATTAELQPRSQVYPIINKGCLLESRNGNSVFLPRYHSSSIILYLQSFKLGSGEMYIHCKLTVWDPEALDEDKKACHYVKGNDRWELLDDPSQSSLCSCCDSSCKSRLRRGVEWASDGPKRNSVLGPIIIVDQSDLKDSNTLMESVTTADSQLQ
ncbi:zona pellucida sperm-binding protein 3-like isoform X2 [Archocentrus centrarchus]|uniref:zona pellucida sperm-binding protein 3-like isoform X2 n=1 Tax=Archocentrus centrarchus TaxID=63155 RepID=UPI0011E9D865|nr:zona pellucida sperm-binding protein 3-like isoform X2 [Archocentrus centrarchus]